MYAFRVPFPRKAALAAAAAAAVAASAGTAAQPADAAVWNLANGGAYYYTYIGQTDQKPITSVTISNIGQGGFSLNGIHCAWAQNATNYSPFPAIATINYSHAYINQYGTTPPPYTNDYAGQPTCVQSQSGAHPYNGSPNRRGIAYKAFFQPGQYDSWLFYSDAVY